MTVLFKVLNSKNNGNGFLKKLEKRKEMAKNNSVSTFQYFITARSMEKWRFMMMGIFGGFLISTMMSTRACATPPFDLDLSAERSVLERLISNSRQSLSPECLDDLLALNNAIKTKPTPEECTDIVNKFNNLLPNGNCIKKIDGFEDLRKRTLDKIKTALPDGEMALINPLLAQKEAEIAQHKKTIIDLNNTIAESKKKEQTMLTTLLFVLAGGLLGGLIVWFLFPKRGASQTGERNSADDLRYKIADKDHRIQQLNQQLIDQSNTVNRLENRLKALEKDLQEAQKPPVIPIQTTPEVEEATTKAAQVATVVETLRQQQSTTQPTEFYLSIPNLDGSFNDSDRREYFEMGASLYRFVEVKAGFAEFEFVSQEATVRDAMNNPEMYLLPVCTPQNAKPPVAKSIKTIETGKARLLNGKWLVEERHKARIQYV
jgi:uncharacterized coiled-coil protein SlyX